MSEAGQFTVTGIREGAPLSQRFVREKFDALDSALSWLGSIAGIGSLELWEGKDRLNLAHERARFSARESDKRKAEQAEIDAEERAVSPAFHLHRVRAMRRRKNAP